MTRARVQEKLRASTKVSLKKIDVQDHQGLVAAIKRLMWSSIVPGLYYKTAVAVARAAVEAQVNYIDICDDYEAVPVLFSEAAIDKAAKEAGITVLTGMGSDPGTNNVLVKWYAINWTALTRSISSGWSVSPNWPVRPGITACTW